MLNSASRSRSAVGRIACDLGADSVRPRSLPPTMRISDPAGLYGGDGHRGAAVSPPLASEASGGEGSGVGGISIAISPHPGSRRCATRADPPHRFAGGGYQPPAPPAARKNPRL